MDHHLKFKIHSKRYHGNGLMCGRAKGRIANTLYGACQLPTMHVHNVPLFGQPRIPHSRRFVCYGKSNFVMSYLLFPKKNEEGFEAHDAKECSEGGDDMHVSKFGS